MLNYCINLITILKDLLLKEPMLILLECTGVISKPKKKTFHIMKWYRMDNENLT